jgi:hypothetical protein
MVAQSRLIRVCFLIVILLLAACQTATPTPDLPTLASFPTLTSTNTPTDTPTFTPTATATDTLTPTNTSTPTPTLSATPSVTRTPSITPTFTLTFTATATATPPATATPTAPQIISYTASATNVQVNSQGAVTQQFQPLAATGQYSVVIPGNLGQQVIYRLVAMRNGQEVSMGIPITIQCSLSWFFGTPPAGANVGCPTSAGALADGKFQPFERGFMIYVTANGLNKVYGLATQDSRYIAYVSQWDGSTIVNDSAPGDLHSPEGVFNWAYYNTNAPVGAWNSSIGWGTDDMDDGDRTIQFEQGTNAFYIDAPGGIVFRFSGGDSGTWARIK